MKTIAITREAIAEKPDVIFEAMARLARTADYRNPGPVTIERCSNAEHNATLTAGQERCFIHLSQEEWRK